MTALWAIIGCGVLSIVYGIWAIQSVMSADAGTQRMQEIAAAIAEGAQAYLKRQYMTIAHGRRRSSSSASGSCSAGWSRSAS